MHPDTLPASEYAAQAKSKGNRVSPRHCTGDCFCDLAREDLCDKVIRSAVGTPFVFGAGGAQKQ